MDFKSLFQQQQKILELELNIARERFKHYGLRGGAVEIAMRSFMEQHLPRSLAIGTGEVIATQSDTSENVSAQIDIIISNTMQPFAAARDTPTTFFIESVHMAGEIKTTLNSSVMDKELKKGAKFRALQAKNVSRLVDVKDKSVFDAYYTFYRPYFMLSHETTGDWRKILYELMKYIKRERRIPIDGLFLLDQNICIIVSPYVKNPIIQSDGVPFTHEIKGEGLKNGMIHITKTDVPLALMLTWIASFRVSFFEDIHPLSFYLRDMINSEVSPVQIARLPDTPENRKLAASGNTFDTIYDALDKEFSLKF